MSWKSDWQSCSNILCVRPDNLGDVIMMTPVFRALKVSLPGIKLTLLTSSVGNRVVPFIQEVDESIIYDAPWIENDTLKISRDSIFPVLKELKQRNFDGAILLTNYSQNPLPLAFLLYLAGIPRILGYCRELPNELINYWVPDTEPFTFPVHGIERQLRLLSHIGIQTSDVRLSLKTNPHEDERITEHLKQKGVSLKKPFLILHPGASLKRRCYPEEYYIQAAKQLNKEFNYQILLTGDTKEQTLTKRMQKQIGADAISLSGELTISEFISLIKIAALVISNNTAPVHISAAVKTPVVVLYARGNPEHIPWHVKSRILYFDIPIEKRTKNTTLVFTTPLRNHLMPQPKHIVQAVRELLLHKDKTLLPDEITSWDENVHLKQNEKLGKTEFIDLLSL